MIYVKMMKGFAVEVSGPDAAWWRNEDLLISELS